MRYSLRSQFLAPHAVAVLFGFAFLALFNGYVATRLTRSRVERQIQRVAAVIADSNFPLSGTVLQKMSELANAELLLAKDDGTPLSGSGPAAYAAMQIPISTVQIGSHDKVVLGPVVRYGGDAYFHSAMRVERNAASPERTLLHVMVSQKGFNMAWREAFVPPLLVGLASVLAIVGITNGVVTRLIRFLAKMNVEVSRFADGNFSPVDIPRISDECQDLALAVNRTARMLEAYSSEIRRTEQLRTLGTLGAGLAHEIRNSITGCKMAIGLHKIVCSVQEKEDDSLLVATRQLQLTERRLGQFLRLGRPAHQTPLSPVPLQEVIEASISLVVPTAAHLQVQITFQAILPNCLVLASQELLEQSVTNLLLNGVEAASKNVAARGETGSVHVSAQMHEDEAEIAITDSGDGPRRDLAENLFEPFVSEKPEGIGLGLVVAREAIQSFGGTLQWHREHNKTQFVMRLPIAA